MTQSKGISSKTLDGAPKDEALLLNPSVAARAAEAARKARESGEPPTAKIILELPDAEDDNTQEDTADPPNSSNSKKRKTAQMKKV